MCSTTRSLLTRPGSLLILLPRNVNTNSHTINDRRGNVNDRRVKRNNDNLRSALNNNRTLTTRKFHNLRNDNRYFRLIHERITNSRGVLHLQNTTTSNLDRRTRRLDIHTTVKTTLRLVRLHVRLSNLLNTIANRHTRRKRTNKTIRLTNQMSRTIRRRLSRSRTTNGRATRRRTGGRMLYRQKNDTTIRYKLLHALPDALDEDRVIVRHLANALRFRRLTLRVLGVFVTHLLRHARFHKSPLYRTLVGRTCAITTRDDYHFLVSRVRAAR